MNAGSSHAPPVTGKNTAHLPSIDTFRRVNIIEIGQASIEIDTLQENQTSLNATNTTQSVSEKIIGQPNSVLMVNGAGYSNAPTNADTRQSNPQQKQIQVKSQPRSMHHPRTQREWPKYKDIIQSEGDGVNALPSVFVFLKWQQESSSNIIEVTLVDNQGRPHPYPIRNVDDPSVVIFNRPFTTGALYFRVTSDDFADTSKSFKIAIIKEKQNEIITRKLIRDRQLAKSKLRFRRLYLANDAYCPEEDSTSYTDLMTETYGNIGVKHMNPTFGPMSGGYLLDIVCTGSNTVDKTQLSITVSSEQFFWTHQVKDFEFTGGTIHFPMPAIPCYLLTGQLLAKVSLYHVNKRIYEATYMYDARFDEILKSNDSGAKKSAGADESDMLSSGLMVATCECPRAKRRRTEKQSKRS